MQVLIIFSSYFLILFSIVGYGNIFSKLLKRSLSLSELGFYGLIILILISYITNFFVAHNYLHNTLLFLIGIISFTFFILEKNFDKKLLILTLVVFAILFIGILMHKNHDDFFYYHFAYTISLIEQKKIIGLGHLESGFRTPSSIFYLNSLFYLPFVKLSLINIGAIYYMGFSNIFFLEKIFYYLKKKQTNFILFLSLASLLIVNTAFYRIAEHGTDRSALILIFVLALVYLKSLKYSNILDRKKLIASYENILVLLLLIISLKSFYLIYMSILLVWLIQLRSILFSQNLFIDLLKNKFTYLFIFSVFIFVLTVFLNTSCLVYPASFTCFDSLEWSIPIQQVEAMKDWYSLWSKAGANPNFRTADPELYLSNLNWFMNWLETYFFTKMSDYLGIVIFVSLICYFFLKNKKEKNLTNDLKHFKIFYIFIILLFTEWFLNHPSLRYGGYTVVALLIFLPLCVHISNYSMYTEKLKKIIFFLIIIPFLIFFSKNIKRINSEIDKYNYKPFQNPHYYIVDGAYTFNERLKYYDKVRKKNDKRFYLILSIPFINENK